MVSFWDEKPPKAHHESGRKKLKEFPASELSKPMIAKLFQSVIRKTYQEHPRTTRCLGALGRQARAFCTAQRGSKHSQAPLETAAEVRFGIVWSETGRPLWSIADVSLNAKVKSDLRYSVVFDGSYSGFYRLSAKQAVFWGLKSAEAGVVLDDSLLMFPCTAFCQRTPKTPQQTNKPEKNKEQKQTMNNKQKNKPQTYQTR